MLKFLSLVLATMPALAFAQTNTAPAKDPMMVTDVEPSHRSGRSSEIALDPVNFCYFEGKAYSKGAIHADQICSSGMVVFSNSPGKPGANLSWMPLSKR